MSFYSATNDVSIPISNADSINVDIRKDHIKSLVHSVVHVLDKKFQSKKIINILVKL